MNPPGLPRASRKAPPRVEPIVANGVRYEQVIGNPIPGLDSTGRYLAAYDAATGQVLWTLKVWDMPNIPELERDVQISFFKSMRLDAAGTSLLIDSENGRHFVVDLVARTVRQVDPAPAG